MPQASTSHVRHQPRVKAAPFCPPPFNQLFKAYEAADPNKQLRFGQWFFNSQIRFVHHIKYPYNLDAMYNSTDMDVVMLIIKQMYIDYQWPI